MGKGLKRSMKMGASPANHTIIKHRVAVSDLAVSTLGATGVGWGTAVMGDLPEGNILFLGAVSYMTFSGQTDANLGDTWAGDYGIGTTPADDATISAADVDIIQSTALAAATAEVSPRTRGVHLLADSGDVLDNTDGSLELNLNLLIDDADIGADSIVLLATGEVEILFAVLLDD